MPQWMKNRYGSPTLAAVLVVVEVLGAAGGVVEGPALPVSHAATTTAMRTSPRTRLDFVMSDTTIRPLAIDHRHGGSDFAISGCIPIPSGTAITSDPNPGRTPERTRHRHPTW